LPVRVSDIPAITSAAAVNVLIEIPRGGQIKFELDERYDVIRFDRALHGAVHYPTEYGFVPQTVGEDGQHLDALVVVDQPTFPGCLIETRLLGALGIQKEQRPVEHKLLCVPVAEPRLEEWRALSDVPDHLMREIEQFFQIFKDLEGEEIKSRDWVESAAARRVLERAMSRWAAR
jgi:inorganic pyrophosphatase